MKKKYFIAITQKEKEFIYNVKNAIMCNDLKNAIKISNFLNNHNDSAINGFELKNENEYWYVYEYDGYTYIPYKIKNTKNKISIVFNEYF